MGHLECLETKMLSGYIYVRRKGPKSKKKESYLDLIANKRCINIINFNETGSPLIF